MLSRARVRLDTHDDLALIREFDCVDQRIETDLPQPHLITNQINWRLRVMLKSARGSCGGLGSTFYFTCRVDVQSAHDDDSSDKSPLVGTRVLVADDNAASRAVIGEILNSAGASVSLCSGAAPARQELSRAHKIGFEYHVILLNARMLSDNGIELARELDRPIANGP